MTRKTTPCICISPNITAKIPRKALPCTDGRRITEKFKPDDDVGNNSLERAFPLARSADPSGGAGLFLRHTFHDALLVEPGGRAHGNSSGAERAAEIRHVFRVANRGRV